MACIYEKTPILGFSFPRLQTHKIREYIKTVFCSNLSSKVGFYGVLPFSSMITLDSPSLICQVRDWKMSPLFCRQKGAAGSFSYFSFVPSS